MKRLALLLPISVGFASTNFGRPELDAHRINEISCTATAITTTKSTFAQLKSTSTDEIFYIATETSSLTVYDIPQLIPRGIGQIKCKTTNTSPAEANLKSFGDLSPFPDGRGFCLTLNAICPGQLNNLCAANPDPAEVVWLAYKNNVIIIAVGRTSSMELLCKDIVSGLDSLRKKCTNNGKVEGSIQYDGRDGKGYVTIHVMAASRV